MSGRSESLYQRARKVMPGGVSSPVRAYQPYPRYISSAKGDRITDVDGNEYILHGLRPHTRTRSPDVVSALQHRRRGLSTGPHRTEPSSPETYRGSTVHGDGALREQQHRATMHALRLARGHTGRKKVLKFEVASTGHDAVLVKAGSGATTHVPPTHWGPEEVTCNTLVATYNDLGSVESALRAHQVKSPRS